MTCVSTEEANDDRISGDTEYIATNRDDPRQGTPVGGRFTTSKM